ncbi:MAG: hypothetical protein IKQ47_07665 [Prevotella sp.]|nr:hypothetical protein [Prevotella sp.]
MLALASCSDDDIVSTPTVTDLLDQYAVTGTMASSAEFEGGIGDADGENERIASKSQLYYDRVNNKLKFTWTTGDMIGIFPESNDKGQFAFILDSSTPLTVQETSVSGVFEPYDKEAAYPISATAKYYSYFPYTPQTLETGEFTFNAVPVSYRNQTQTANEQMNLYFRMHDDDFLETEKAASAHLAGYDYMVSDVTSTEAAHVHFNYSHMGSIVRFYIQCPATSNPGLFVDSLQVVNEDKLFVTDAAMNINAKTFEERTMSRAMSLKFAPAVDMTNNYDDTKGTYNYWNSKKPANGYIMAYMMIAPTDLSRAEVQNSTLYLIARQPHYYTTKEEYNEYYGTTLNDAAFAALTQAQKMKVYKNVADYNAGKLTSISSEEFAALTVDQKLKEYERKVYKATLSKINFEAGKHYQWKPALNPDEPITFTEITIQEWEQGTTFTNEDGTGTEDW